MRGTSCGAILYIPKGSKRYATSAQCVVWSNKLLWSLSLDVHGLPPRAERAMYGAGKNGPWHAWHAWGGGAGWAAGPLGGGQGNIKGNGVADITRSSLGRWCLCLLRNLVPLSAQFGVIGRSIGLNRAPGLGVDLLREGRCGRLGLSACHVPSNVFVDGVAEFRIKRQRREYVLAGGVVNGCLPRLVSSDEMPFPRDVTRYSALE
jgi:hypothetical protein